MEFYDYHIVEGGPMHGQIKPVKVQMFYADEYSQLPVNAFNFMI